MKTKVNDVEVKSVSELDQFEKIESVSVEITNDKRRQRRRLFG